MKRILLILLTLGLLLSVATAELLGQWNQTTLILYSQEDVISDQVLRAFTQATGIHVTYRLPEEDSTHSWAESDLVVGDQEWIAQRLAEEALAPLDRSRLEDLPQMEEDYLALSWDPENRYTIPCLWTTMGLVYDPSQTDLRVTGWSSLFDGRFAHALAMPSDSGTAFAVALAALGMDVNTNAQEDLIGAASYLAQQQDQVYAYCSPDQLAPLFQSGAIILAPCAAGDAIGLMANLPELSFVIPSEGSWRTLLSYAIPAASQKQEAAHALLEFLCSPTNQAKNAAYSGYSVVSQEAYDRLDPAWQANPLAYPRGAAREQSPLLTGQIPSLQQERQVRWLMIQMSQGPDAVPFVQPILTP